jgi:hypothetical protein
VFGGDGDGREVSAAGALTDERPGWLSGAATAGSANVLSAAASNSEHLVVGAVIGRVAHYSPGRLFVLPSCGSLLIVAFLNRGRIQAFPLAGRSGLVACCRG